MDDEYQRAVRHAVYAKFDAYAAEVVGKVKAYPEDCRQSGDPRLRNVWEEFKAEMQEEESGAFDAYEEAIRNECRYLADCLPAHELQILWLYCDALFEWEEEKHGPPPPGVKAEGAAEELYRRVAKRAMDEELEHEREEEAFDEEEYEDEDEDDDDDEAVPVDDPEHADSGESNHSAVAADEPEGRSAPAEPDGANAARSVPARYANISDEELRELAAAELTDEAWAELEREFEKRGLAAPPRAAQTASGTVGPGTRMLHRFLATAVIWMVTFYVIGTFGRAIREPDPTDLERDRIPFVFIFAGLAIGFIVWRLVMRRMPKGS